MGLRDDLLRMPLEQRFTYDPQQNLFFVNFEGSRRAQPARRRGIRADVEAKLAPLGHKVHAIVNYDNFSIFPDILDDYSAMVSELVDRFYSGVTRYTTSGFLRMKLGDALDRRARRAAHLRNSRMRQALICASLRGRPRVKPTREFAHGQASKTVYQGQ